MVQANCYSECLVTFEESEKTHTQTKYVKHTQSKTILFFLCYYRHIILSSNHGQALSVGSDKLYSLVHVPVKFPVAFQKVSEPLVT